MIRAMLSTTRIFALVAGLALLAVAWPAAPHARAQVSGNSVRGSGKGVYGPFALHAGLAVMRTRYGGTGFFAVYLINQDPTISVPVTQDPDNSRKDTYYPAGATGSAADILKTDDNYYFWVSDASGPYELSVEQPSPSTAVSVNQRTFSGKGEQVTPIFSLPAGSYNVTLATDSDSAIVKLYRVDDLGGGPVVSDLTGYYGDHLIAKNFPPAYTAVPVDIPADGLFIFYVENLEEKWTVSIQ